MMYGCSNWSLVFGFLKVDCFVTVFSLFRLVAGVGRHCPRLRLLDLSGTEEVREAVPLKLNVFRWQPCQVTEEGSTKLFRTTVGGELWPTELTSTLQ